jgi:hypothetical protein
MKYTRHFACWESGNELAGTSSFGYDLETMIIVGCGNSARQTASDLFSYLATRKAHGKV